MYSMYPFPELAEGYEDVVERDSAGGKMMLGEAERAAVANLAPSGYRIAHRPYVRDCETQSVFRALRQKIRVLLSESATVAVCAAAPGEGASWAAAMLACATAEDRGSVMLVDGDVEKATQKSSFEITGAACNRLPPMLEQHFDLYGTSTPQISILTPSEGVSCSEREAGASLRVGLSAIRSRWDNIILDCPPIPASGLLVDIAPSVDGVILVVKAERERRDELKHRIEWLKRMSAPLLGVVFNKATGHLPRFLERSL
jgi:Mrp family chromosome partitioning ATPase